MVHTNTCHPFIVRLLSHFFRSWSETVQLPGTEPGNAISGASVEISNGVVISTCGWCGDMWASPNWHVADFSIQTFLATRFFQDRFLSAWVAMPQWTQRNTKLLKKNYWIYLPPTVLKLDGFQESCLLPRNADGNIMTALFFSENPISNKDELFPFPWNTRSNNSVTERCVVATDVPPEHNLPAECGRLKAQNRKMATYIREFPDLTSLLAECETLGCITFQLPVAKAPAGKVLAHATSTFEGFHQRHRPMIFKLGFTTNAAFRLTNSKYGYAKDRDGWSGMVVVYLSNEPAGPAMLEAALIDKYASIWTEQITDFLFDFPSIFKWIPKKGPRSPGEWAIQGTPGCRNVRAGGDSVIMDQSASSVRMYMTYFVYRSFKVPPPIKERPNN